jgi:hypothetical protein
LDNERETIVVDASEWLPAKKVLEKLTADGRNPAEVETMLAAYLRNGSLHAYAEAIWRSDERFTTQAWKSCPDDAVGGPIPLKYWRFEKAALEDRSQWRLVANRFLATTRLKPRRRIMMKGVSFSVADLAKLQPHIFSSLPAKRKRGPNADLAKRDAAWLTLLDVLFDTTDPAANWQTIDGLAVEMHGKQTAEFGDGNRKDVARLALNRLKQHDAVGFKAGGKPPST